MRSTFKIFLKDHKVHSTKNNLDFISIETWRGREGRDGRVERYQEEEGGTLAKGQHHGREKMAGKGG